MNRLAGMALAVPAVSMSAQDNIRDSVELEPVVVTASHTPKALKDAPVVTRLITPHDLRIADATNIQDMLIQELPGLEFGFAMSQETSLNMSGFGSRSSGVISGNLTPWDCIHAATSLLPNESGRESAKTPGSPANARFGTSKSAA